MITIMIVRLLPFPTTHEPPNISSTTTRRQKRKTNPWPQLWHAHTPTDLIGNVYARFKYEDSAQQACDALNSRWYAARPIYCELSPVTDFREACCRLNSGEGCVRGGFCNFIHRKEPTPEMERELELGMKKWLKVRGRDERSMTRSPSPEPTRKRF